MASKQGGKNRKYGRWLKSPSMKRYVFENRYEGNKRKRAVRHAKRIAKQAAKVQRRSCSLGA